MPLFFYQKIPLIEYHRNLSTGFIIEPNKLTSNEKLAIGLLVISVYGKNTDKESLYGYAKFNKGNDKTFTLTIEDMHNQNKVVSTKTMKTSDFAQKR